MFSMKKTVIFCSFVLLIFTFIVQSVNSRVLAIVPQPKASVDSSKIKAELRSKRHLKHKKFIQAADTLSKGDYLLSIDRVNDNLIDIRDSAKLGFEIVNIKHQIENISKDFKRIQLNFGGGHSKVNTKNLFLYQEFATNLDEKNDLIINHLQKLYLRVYHAKLRVKTVLKDSVFKVMYADSLLRNAFEYKLIGLEHKWIGTDSITKLNIDSINALKVIAVDNSINLTDMMSMVNRKLESANQLLINQEFNYLWQPEMNLAIRKDSGNKNDLGFKNISLFESEQNAISFYISQTEEQRLYVLAFALLLFIWLFMKRKLLKNIKIQKDKYEFLNLQYLNKLPFLLLLIIVLYLMPFFDAYAPTSYIAIEYFLLLSASVMIFFKKEEKTLRIDWLILSVLFGIDVLTYLFSEPTFVARLWMITVQVAILVFTYRYYFKINKQNPYFRWLKVSAFVAILLSTLAIISNLFGRFTLAGIFGLAGIFAITQAVVLTIFIETIMEMIVLQLIHSRLKKGVDIPFDSSIVIEKIKMPVLIVAVIIWFITLTSSLNVYHTISDNVVDALTVTRTLGSISFKLTSVLMFFVIIWFAHILQRLLSFLFGETGIETEDSTTITKGQHSRLLITRLLVLIGGYLLAIAASGLPIDKLTFLLGALGVGIGMGLQNVVNNFVSGIILIFDGSLQIDDEIEVNGQAGKVKEIGLRACTLSTADGAEVIIPNGIILSQNIINWTFSNDQKRVTIGFSLTGKELDANVINEIINQTIENIPNVVAKRKPVILYNKVTQDGCALTVRFWSTISKADPVKSDAMLNLNKAFAAKNIGFE